MRRLTASTNLTITNPLVLYRSLVATKQIEPDPAQHRLAIHLQKVHGRLRGYRPEVDFRERLQHIRSLIGQPSSKSAVTVPHEIGPTKGFWSTWREKSKDAEITALTRRLTDQQTAAELNSPQGILLHGEVGTGKSLLIELLGECLPSDGFQRWHFNTFMLSVYAKIEKLRVSTLGSEYDEYALLRLSRDLVFESPILFIDEFQFPDRASSKILSNLLTSFFHLGGVLVATSNRMPEQLADAAGFEFNDRRSTVSSTRNDATLGQRPGKRNLTGGDFDDFLELLKARCETWNIEGTNDWRKRDAIPKGMEARTADQHFEMGQVPESSSGFSLGEERSLAENSVESDSIPPYYFIASAQDSLDEQRQQLWMQCESEAVNQHDENVITWTPDTKCVYGRTVAIPRQHNGATKWTFEELCGAYLGPADYVSLASSFHTFIITDVPVLTLLQKNEGRRFITLLDAMYEARCRLLLSCQARPDHIFFPERLFVNGNDDMLDNIVGDAVYSETFAEIHQDQTLPFRPNVSSYASSASQPDYAASPIPMTHSNVRSILADEDSDFGPVYGAGRHQGQHFEQSEELNTVLNSSVGPNFSRVESFTGQDEMFAFKRAESRLWEMCGERWWAKGITSWRPLTIDARHWEHSALKSYAMPNGEPLNGSRGPDHNDTVFPHGASPFRRSEEPPPRFNWTHAWGMALWGKKAGAWGRGPQGLADRKKPDEQKDPEMQNPSSR